MASDILERAKSLRHYLANKAEWQDESVIVGELISEVGRLRSENKIISDRAAHHEKQDAAEIELLAARIRELEEANRNIDKRRDEMAAFIEWLEAAFLKSETERKFYTTINGMNSEFDWNGYPECPQNGIHKEWFRQQAREALERIKEEREG